MDKSFADLCLFVTPRMNDQVMEGYIRHEAKHMLPRLKAVLHKAYDGLLDGNLKFIGIEPCTPQEEFDVASRPRNPRRTFELAQSDLFLTKLKIEYRGMPIPDPHLYLPYFGPGGTLHLGGPLHHIIPVLADKVISPEARHLFVHLNQYKMNISELDHSIVVDGERTSGFVAWGNVYRQSSAGRRRATTKANSVLAHYLFCRHGVLGAFQKYLGFTPILGVRSHVNEKNYPKDAWTIVSSAYDRTPPPDYVLNTFSPTEHVLAIPNNKWNARTKSLVTGLYYVLDNFPSFLEGEKIFDELSWHLSLAEILFNTNFKVGKRLKMVDDHFQSSDSYMDDDSIEKLMQNGHRVENFTDLLALLALDYQDLKMNAGGKYYGKYLDALREVLAPITYMIFTNKYALMKDSNNALPSYAAVKDRFIRKFSPRAIFALTSAKGKKAEVVSYSGDHVYYKMTARLALQESSPGNGSGKTRFTISEEHHLNTPQMMCGSILFLQKTKPIPIFRINPYVITDPKTGTVLENPKFKEELARVDELLARKC